MKRRQRQKQTDRPVMKRLKYIDIETQTDKDTQVNNPLNEHKYRHLSKYLNRQT